MIELSKITRLTAGKDTLALLDDATQLKHLDLDRSSRAHLQRQLDDGAAVATCEEGARLVMVHLVREGDRPKQLELARRAGNEMVARLHALKAVEAQLAALHVGSDLAMAMAEGVVLGGYAFRKYKSGDKGVPTLKLLRIAAAGMTERALEELTDVCEATCTARDLVNEPVSFLTAQQFSAEIRNLSRTCGFKLQVVDKSGIEALGMGGLLAVNKGSVDPPTFNVLEWKPKGAVNKAPLLLVGKGVVYDTGGLSLKPTPNSMDYMKCDMAGGAAVAAAIGAAAQQELPLHVVGLIPATDNRPGGNAYAPGDVIRMHNGSTMEMVNADAEGRIILADALSYGERYKAELVLTIATLTGAAARAIGTYGVVAMGTAGHEAFELLSVAGDHVHERIARMPFWEEYDAELESEIADVKNLGGEYAGHITAGKFLARFTTRPLIHLDIAGPAYLNKRDHYRPKGGTGTGVRLLYDFMRRRAGRR
jgi:leucyl aminopeptidase